MIRPLLSDRELGAALRPWLRRVQARFWLETARTGIIRGLAWAALVLAAARLVPWAKAPAWALGGAGVIVALTMAAAWPRRPLWGEAAAAADGLGLRERAVTALELSAPGPGPDSAPGDLAPLIRADALSHLSRQDTGGFSLMPRRRPWAHTALLAAVTLVLIILPNPTRDAALRQARDERAREQTLGEIAKLEKQASHLDPVDEARRREAAEILRRLAGALPREPEKAAGAVAEAREEISRLLTPGERGAGEALAALARSWDQGILAAAGNALSRGDATEAAQALEELADRLASLSDGERQALADALQAGANAVRGRPELAAALRQAAGAIASAAGTGTAGGVAAAAPSAAALAGVGQALTQAGDDAAGAAALEGLLASVGDLQQALSGGNAAGGGQAASAGGSAPVRVGGAGTGKSGSPGDGGGSSGNGGTPGDGDGSGGGNQPGGGGGGMGPGQLPSGSSLGTTGPYEQVLDPSLLGGQGDPSSLGGQPSAATGDQVAAPWSPTVTGSLRPYREMLPRYQEEARDALQRQNLPPALRELVREYFSSLGGAGSARAGEQGAP